MTTKELILKAHKIASKYFDVEHIEVEHAQGFEKNEPWERLGITCFYTFRGERSNFWAYIHSKNKDFGTAGLIRQFKIAVRHERNKLFPPEPQSKDLEISEPEKTEDHGTSDR